MKSISTLWFICVSTLVAVLGAPPAHASDVYNGHFETGSFDGWTESGGLWYGGTNYPADYGFGAAPYQSAIVIPGDVPCLWSKGVSVNEVRSDSYAARLNSNDAGAFHFSQIQQTVYNWTSPYFMFDWSAVLQDSGHTRANRPHFRIILRDLTTGITIHNVAYYSDDATIGMWQRTGPAMNDWSYSGWTQMEINTPNMVGDTLQVTILAADCAEGVHNGALYVDNIMGAPETGNSLPVARGVVRLNRVLAGTTVTLDGRGSSDAENDTIDAYDWDFNGDGVTDQSGGAQQTWTVPSTWAAGAYTLNLRVREQPPTPLPAQWSPWAPVTLTVIGPPDAAHSIITPATAAIPANGQSTHAITVWTRDSNNAVLTNSGEIVVIRLASGTGMISPTIDNRNGSYFAMVTAPPTPGVGTFTATMGGIQVGTAVGAQQSVVTYAPIPSLWAGLTTSNTVFVVWPWSELSWQLQAATNLLTAGTVWTPCSYQTNGVICYHSEAPTGGGKFYRLKQP